MTHVCIVGNAPLTRDHSEVIDSADQVIRFNIPFEWGQNAGRKFDTWVLAGGRTGRKFGRTKAFVDAPYRDLPNAIWIAHDPVINKEINDRYGIRKVFGEKDHGRFMKSENGLTQPITRFRPPIYRKCLKDLGNPHLNDEPQIPSSGYLTLQYVRKHTPEARISMVGFGFEGWVRHPWEIEKQIVTQMAADGQLTLIPC